MKENSFILNENNTKIENITFKNNELIIDCNNPKCSLNINLKYDINSLELGEKVEISKYIYKDQNFVTDKYSYVIAIDKNIYLTKLNDNNILFELNLPNVEILIPPFDNINKKRIELSDNEIEIHSLEVKVSFNI